MPPSRPCRAGTNGSARSAIRGPLAGSITAFRTKSPRRWGARSPGWPWPRSCGPCRRRNGGPELARGVVAKLVLGQLEADQLLKGRPGDCSADDRVRHRIDGGIGIARPADASELAADLVGQSDGAAADPANGLGIGLCTHAAGDEIERDITDLLGNDVAAALGDDIVIGKRHLPRLRRVAAGGD